MDEPSARLYIGNLSFSARAPELFDLFSTFGEIEQIEVVMYADCPRSKGFAFVEFVKAEDADRARAALHQTQFMGRNLLVRPATARVEPMPRASAFYFRRLPPGG